MGFLSWIWDGLKSIFAPEPEPEPEPDIIEAVIEIPAEIWRAVTGEAREEWREERADREAKEQLSMDLVIEGEWEAAKEEWPEMITDEDLRRKYNER